VEVNGKRLADYGLKSERVLWKGKGPGVFETELGNLEDRLMLTTVEKAIAWAQGSSIWPDTFGLACCAIEMMSIVSARYDIARFGAEVFRSSPRQADRLIVSGRVAHKMAAPLRQIYDQMLEPKWVIAMGACASSGGMFNNYTVLQGVDKIVAVDVHVPGCPPRPEALMEGIVRLHEKGALERERRGRAHAYRPVSDRAGLVARRMSQVLDASVERDTVLARFVGDLSDADEALVRRLLGE